MILVCGEALIDLFVDAPADKAMPARAVAGGSPFNVAIGLARLGIRSAFLGGISRDRFGTFLADTLAGEGVDDRYLVRTDRLSTISVVATARDGQPSYAFHGEGAADRSLHPGDLPATLPDDIRALTFGSYTMVVEPVGTTLAALAQREHGRRVISVDPNLRPSVVSDMHVWASAAERFYRTATIIKARQCYGCVGFQDSSKQPGHYLSLSQFLRQIALFGQDDLTAGTTIRRSIFQQGRQRGDGAGGYKIK